MNPYDKLKMAMDGGPGSGPHPLSVKATEASAKAWKDRTALSHYEAAKAHKEAWEATKGKTHTEHKTAMITHLQQEKRLSK